MKNKLKSIKGITLIALIVTIIVLLILAGVAIVTLTGENGLLSKASNARQVNDQNQAKEELQQMLMEIQVEIVQEGNRQPTVTDCDKLANKEGIQKIQYITKLASTETKIVRVKNPQYALVTYKNYVFTIDNKLSIVKIQEDSDIVEDEDFENFEEVTGEYKNVNGLYMCTPQLSSGFDKYTTRYLNEENGKLVLGNWIGKGPDEDWYDYSNKKWANIYVENNGSESYFVWIPRFVYKKDTEHQESGNQRMDIKFVDLDNKYIDGKTEEEKDWKTLQSEGYQLPEAFWWNNNGDGNKDSAEQLPGYWMSKYQITDVSTYKLDFNVSLRETTLEIKDIKISDTSKNIEKYVYSLNGKLKKTLKKGENFKLTGVSEANKVVNVTALDANGEVVGSMTKVAAEANKPDISKFDPEKTFYVYWDEKGVEHNDVPISQKPPAEWYNYPESKWANIVIKNNGLENYFVWIPRYEYRLEQDQRSSINFITTDVTNGNCSNGYKVPEAFWWDNNGNGVEDAGEQLTGYWMSKYQVSDQ